jgi:hypothetical protein
MEYYILTNSTKTEEIGRKYPQCKGVPYGYTFKWFEQDNSMTKLNNMDFPDFIPDLKFELEDSAKLSDMVSPSNISAVGILCNSKMLNVLNKFNIHEFRIFDAELYFKGEKHNYFWIHLICKDVDQIIDYKKSKFNLSKYRLEVGEEVNFLSSKEAKKIKHENDSYLLPTKIVLKENQNLDLFFLPITYDIIISDDLKREIEKNKLIGITIKLSGETY